MSVLNNLSQNQKKPLNILSSFYSILYISNQLLLKHCIGPSRVHAQCALNLALFFFLFLSFFFFLPLLFFQKGFAYDFEILHAFLSNKKTRFNPKKTGVGGALPSPPKSSFLGGQQACEPVKLQLLCVNRVRALWVSKDPPRRKCSPKNCKTTNFMFGLLLSSQLTLHGQKHYISYY